ncbi:UNVERIFIED_CONTAM: hypothetical protein RMT77_008878 [Armadillidium vulgare]
MKRSQDGKVAGSSEDSEEQRISSKDTTETSHTQYGDETFSSEEPENPRRSSEPKELDCDPGSSSVISEREFKEKNSTSLESSQNFVRSSSISKKLRRSFSTDKPASFSDTQKPKSSTESEDVKQPEIEETKSSEQPSDEQFIETDSTSSETSFESSENFIRTSSVNKKLRRSFSTDKPANFSGTEETRSPTEAEDVKQPEIEETKSSQQPSVGQSVGTYSDTSLDTSKKILKNSSIIKKLKRFFSTGETGKLSEPEDVRQPETEERKSSQPSDREFIGTDSTSSPETSFESCENFVRSSSINKKLRRSFSTDKPASFSSTEETRSFTEAEDVKQPKIEETKSSQQPSDEQFIERKSSSSPATSFESSQKIVRSSVSKKLKSSFSTDKSASFSVTEETKSPTEAEDVKQPEIEETKSSQQPSDEQFIGTESLSSPETSYESFQNFVRTSSINKKLRRSFSTDKPASFSGAEETRNSEPADVCKPEFQEEICSQEPEFQDAKSSQQLEIEDAKFSGKPEAIRSFIFSEDSITSDSSDRLYIADDRLSTPKESPDEDLPSYVGSFLIMNENLYLQESEKPANLEEVINSETSESEILSVTTVSSHFHSDEEDEGNSRLEDVKCFSHGAEPGSSWEYEEVKSSHNEETRNMREHSQSNERSSSSANQQSKDSKIDQEKSRRRLDRNLDRNSWGFFSVCTSVPTLPDHSSNIDTLQTPSS